MKNLAFILLVAAAVLAFSTNYAVASTLYAVVVVPEPSTFVLLAAGAIGLIAWKWCRRRS